jgi:hypothetical protein
MRAVHSHEVASPYPGTWFYNLTYEKISLAFSSGAQMMKLIGMMKKNDVQGKCPETSSQRRQIWRG